MEEFQDKKLTPFKVEFTLNDINFDFIVYDYDEDGVRKSVYRNIQLTHPQLATNFDVDEISVKEFLSAFDA